MLWLLIAFNLPGTVYGYFWYADQMKFTAERISPIWLPFVPDSPTASLFFTLFIFYLLWDRRRVEDDNGPVKAGPVRSFIEAFAMITSFKYGIWAVAMIVAGAYQGNELQWQDWMLMGSHLGMAAEALLYLAWYRFAWGGLLAASAWMLLNDSIDYGIGVYPWLPQELEDFVPEVAVFTMILSLVSIGLGVLYRILRKTPASKQV